MDGWMDGQMEAIIISPFLFFFIMRGDNYGYDRTDIVDTCGFLYKLIFSKKLI